MGSSVANFCPIPTRIYLWLFLCLRVVAADSGTEFSIGKPDDIGALFGNLTDDFDTHELGCSDLTGPVDVYTWRPPGYGSNINFMMVPWVHALLLGRRDLALVVNHGVFDLVKCLKESNGVETVGGFSCLFAAMPHLCIFQTNKDWESFMIERNVPTAARKHALNQKTLKSDRGMIPNIRLNLNDSKIDLISSMAVVLDYLHSHRQPWLMRDIQSILDEPATVAVREVPYISLHVRRGDKIIREAKAHDVKEYLKAASSYFQNSTNSTEATVSIEDIRGIWVSSDDEGVISDVKLSFTEFFPNVELERVGWISNRSFTNDTKVTKDALPTKTKVMHYGSYVVFFAELAMMTEGNIFVGTFSSNVARMMVLLREAKGLPRTSSLSVDEPAWFPGRRLLVKE